jgi:putative FmdB family regulatory protein
MPIYGYRCEQCGQELEILQSISAEPLRVCSNCGGQLRKMIYPVGVIYKGSGYYTTDYKGNSGAKASGSSSDGGSERAKTDSDGAAKSDAPKESKSESKAESTSESKPAAKSSEGAKSAAE